MKRFLFALVACIFAVSFFSALSTARVLAANQLDRDTAILKIRQFSELRKGIGLGFRWFDGIGPEDNIEDHVFDPNLVVHKHYVESTDFYGDPYTIEIHKRYLPVAPGYSEEELKAKLGDLFTEHLAATVIARSETFFNEYIHENGKDYFRVQFGTQFSPYKNEPTVYFKDEDINALRFVSQGDGVATVAVTATAHNFRTIEYPEPAQRIDSFDALFEFVNVEGEWKISSFDMTGVFFTQPEVSTKGEFTKDIALSCVKGVVFDIYYNMICGGEFRFDIDGFGSAYDIPLFYDHEEKQFYDDYSTKTSSFSKVDLCVSDPLVWLNHALAFCSPEVADKMVLFSGPLYIYNGEVYYSVDNSQSNRVVYNDFAAKEISADNITILSETDGKASVTYTIPSVHKTPDFRVDNGPLTLHFEFTNTDEGWKITGGDFIEELNDAYEILIPDRSRAIEQIPGTSVEGIPVVATVACLAIILSVATMELRRRENI